MSFFKVLEDFTFTLPSTSLAVKLEENEVIDVTVSGQEDRQYLDLLVEYEFIQWVVDELG